MGKRVAINGFGRIGRLVFKRIVESFKDIEVAAINDITDIDTLIHLLKYDSVHGKFSKEIKKDGDNLIIGERKIKILTCKDPEKLPWQDMGVDIAIESTGLFRNIENAKKHLKAGANKVLITAPAKNPDATVVLGVNEDIISEDDKIISNASCTTNCLAPVAKVLNDNFKIKSGILNTVHSYTTSQNILDGPHRKDMRRARAAAMSIIPTSTGAAIATTKVLPELKGKIDGLALRVPSPDGSIIDFTAVLEKNVTKDDINEAMKKASENYLKGILEYSEEPFVSVDIIDNPHSTVFDAQSTMVVEKNTVKILSWYDNEWGYSSRVVDLVKYLDKKF